LAYRKENSMTASLQQKLQLKPGQAVVILNAPPGCPDKLMSELKENVVFTAARVNAQAVILFVNSLAEAKGLAPGAIQMVKTDGLVWIAYPKGSSKVKTDVNRDSLWEAVKVTGWRPVRLIALDEVWSVMRFRPEEKVGKKA
jgi:hypothetical protein